MDHLKTLCRIADDFPHGIHEGHPMLDELTLYTLKERKLIRPKHMTRTGTVYELTGEGWEQSMTNHKKYDN